MTHPGPVHQRVKLLLKFVVALGVIALLIFLFIRSAGEVRAEPYTLPRTHLQGWSLVLESAASPHEALLSLQPRPELVHELFRQVFSRAMESMTMSTTAAIPVLLRGEYDRAFAAQFTPDELLARARTAGLDTATPEPRCVGHKRISEPGSTRQLFYALFDAPAATRFREELAALLPGGTPAFDPAAQSPVLFISTTGAGVGRWLPLRVDRGTDCVAPITLE